MTGQTRRQLLKATAATSILIPTALQPAPRIPTVARASERAHVVLQKAFSTLPAPAVSMAMADQNGVRWASALGQANLELGVAATAAHLFPLGSVSKVITATAAARLATRGVIDLDAPIARWMPNLPEQHRATTLRHLLTHRGGIRHFNKDEPDMGNPEGAIYMRFYPTETDILGLFINDPLVAPPGKEVRYSSYGYTLASAAMSQAANRSFLDLVRQEVAEPFALPSLMPDDPWSIIPARSGQYINDLDVRQLCASLPDTIRPALTNGWARMSFNNPAYSWAGAGFVMTPSDAARFGVAMLASSRSVLTNEQRSLLFTPVTEATRTSPPLGLGWRIDTDKAGRARWHHAGATPGGSYLLALYPDQGLAVAIASNVMTMKLNAMQTAADLVDAFQN